MGIMKKAGIMLAALIVALSLGCGNVKTASEPMEKESGMPGEVSVLSEEPSDNPLFKVPKDLGFDNYREILKEVCGKDSDYGMLYGTTAVLCRDAGLAEFEENAEEKPLSELVNEENIYLLDFTLPLFEDKFISADDAELTKVLVQRFCKFVYDKYGFEKLKSLLLTPADDEERVTLKNEWLIESGVSLVYEPFACYNYAFNDNRQNEKYPYVVHEENFNMFFKTIDVTAMGYKDFMAGYADIHKYAPDDFRDVQEHYWKNLDDDTIAPPDIYTKFQKDGRDDFYDRFSAMYDKSINQIEIYGDWDMAKWALVHEYVHYIDRHHWYGVDSMVLEAYTEELAVYECRNYLRQQFLTGYCEGYFEGIDVLNPETGLFDASVYNDLQAVAMYTGTDKEWESLTGGVTERWTKDRTKVLFSEMSYHAASSFYHFLTEKLGEKKVHFASGKLIEFYELFEGDYESLYREWGDGLVEKYGDHLDKLEEFFN